MQLRSLSIENFILAEELFATALRSFEICVLINNSLRGKLLPSLESPATFEEMFWRSYFSTNFIPDFKLLSCELDNYTFKVLYLVVLYWYYIKENKFRIL